MAAHRHAIAVSDAHLFELVDRRLRARHELRHVRVVRLLPVLTDDGHRRVVENAVAGGEQEQMVRAAGTPELVR